MKTKLYSEIPSLASLHGVETRSNRLLECKALVDKVDNVNFEEFEIRLPSGEQLQVQSEQNHIYYVLDGTSAINISGNTHSLVKDTLAAIPAGQPIDIQAETNTRMLLIRVDPGDVIPRHHIIRTVAEVQGTTRDVDWESGDSRRLLVKSDGFNISVHNTTVHAGSVSPLWYKFNYEAVYYIRGDVEYTWNDGESRQPFHQEVVSDGDGCMMLMDKNDQHKVLGGSVQSECICVFFPALLGMENHDFKANPGGYSSYASH